MSPVEPNATLAEPVIAFPAALEVEQALTRGKP